MEIWETQSCCIKKINLSFDAVSDSSIKQIKKGRIALTYEQSGNNNK